MPPTTDMFASPEAFWAHAVEIWIAGGWALVAIAVVAFAMFAIAIKTAFNLVGKEYWVPERRWRRWMTEPARRRGPLGRLLDELDGIDTVEACAFVFDGVRSNELKPFDRDLKLMQICVSVAPLLGLFGTVTGMLATFGALASGAGGDQTMGMIAKGISEALITTETGLIVALPGLFIMYALKRQVERYRAFLAHLESVCSQSIYRKSRAAAAGDRDGEAVAAAATATVTAA
jgi:biopolymer transport protein ExbB